MSAKKARITSVPFKMKMHHYHTLSSKNLSIHYIIYIQILDGNVTKYYISTVDRRFMADVSVIRPEFNQQATACY